MPQPLHKIKIGFFAIALVAQLALPFLTLAQEVTVEDLAPLPGQEPTILDDLPGYSSGSSQASSQLQQTRSKDKQKCEGSKYFDGLAGKLQGMLQERLPQIIETALVEQLPEQLQGILSERMPEIVEHTVTEGLTRALSAQIGTLISQGVRPEDINQSVIQGIIAESLPQILAEGLQREIPRVIANDFRQLGPNLLQTALRDPNSGLVASMRENLADELGDAIDNAIDNLNNSNSNLSNQGRNQLGILSRDRGNYRDSLLDGALGLLDDSLNDNEAMNQISGDMADQMEDILASQLAGILGQPEIAGAFNQASQQISISLSEELASLGSDLSDEVLASLDDTVNEIVAQISTPISQAVSDSMTEALAAVANPINAAISGMTTLITEPIVQITGGLVNSITEPFTEAMDGLVDSVVEPFSEGLTNMMDTVLSPLTELSESLTSSINGAFSNAVGSVTNILPFASVPTKEEPTSNISVDTDAIRDLQNKTCADVETAKKIAADQQKKELVDDRKASEQAQKNLDKIGNQTVQIIKKNELVKDISQIIKSSREEAREIDLAQLEKSNDTFRQGTLKTLRGDELADPRASTLSQSEYNELINNRSQLDSQTFWDRFLKLNDITKNNNPSNSLLNNLALQSERVTKAEQDARNTFVAGQGILPITECNKYDQNNNCVDKVVVTPGRIVGAYLEEVNAARIQKQVSADEQTDLVRGAEPTTELIQTLNAPGASSASGFANIFRLNRGGSSNTGGGTNLPNINPGDLLSNIPPTAKIRFTSPSLASVAASTSPNTATLNWSLIIGDKCVAANPWLSSGSTGGTIQVVKRAGEEVERYGSLVIKFPFTFRASFTRTRGSTVVNLTNVPTLLYDRLRGNASLVIQQSELAAGDVITLKLEAGGAPSQVSVTVTEGDTVSTVVDKLKAAVNASTELALYRFTFTPLTSIGTGQIDVVIAPPIYRLSCTNGTKTAEFETTIVR